MLLLGNEAIARGAIEAGVAFTCAYPGTPSSELSLQFFQISQISDLYFEYSTNEKIAMEAASAAANCSIRSMCVMKHVGLNVAADTLMTLAYIGVKEAIIRKTKPLFLESNPRAFDHGFFKSVQSGQRDGLISSSYSVEKKPAKTDDGSSMPAIESNIGPNSP